MGKYGHDERLDTAYHPSQAGMDRDLREPALLFDRTVSVYLNGQPALLSAVLAHLAAAGRGHRVSELAELERWVATLTPAARVELRGEQGSCRSY